MGINYYTNNRYQSRKLNCNNIRCNNNKYLIQLIIILASRSNTHNFADLLYLTTYLSCLVSDDVTDEFAHAHNNTTTQHDTKLSARQIELSKLDVRCRPSSVLRCLNRRHSKQQQHSKLLARRAIKPGV